MRSARVWKALWAWMPGMEHGGEMKGRGGHGARGQGHDPQAKEEARPRSVL